MRPVRHARRSLLAGAGSLLILAGLLPAVAAPVLADSSPQPLPLWQPWTNTGLITLNDDWSGVPGIEGYLGQDITTATGVDPQTLLGQSAATNDLDVLANQTNTAITNGGVAEFQLADPVVALQGSGTADAPYLLITFSTTGRAGVAVSYKLRDIDGTTDNAVQQVALHYRVGTSGSFTNVPAGYVADATTGPSEATLVTPVTATLPAATNDQAVVQVRVMTSNAAGNDEWVGVDDLSVAGYPVINEFSASTAGTDVEYVEVFGTPSTDYSAYRVLEIEGDVGTATGTIDEVISLGSTDAEGLYLANLPANALENGTLTLLLVRDFTGALNTDLDTNDDGVFDSSPWSAIVDAVAVNDGTAGDLTYGVPSLGVGYDGQPFAPGGASRIPDGRDTDTTADWVRNDFDLAGIPGFTGTPIAGEALNTPGAPNRSVAEAMSKPAVDSTVPEDGAANVPTNAPLSVTFTEAVTLDDGAITFECDPEGPAASVDSGPATTFTITYVPPLPEGATCTIDVDGSKVHDADDNAMDGTFSASFTTQGAVTVTRIHAIQGSGDTAAAGTFTVEAIVVGDYQTQGSGQLRGFFVQEEDADVDADPATSEGIFVFCSACPVAVAVGDQVRVTGSSSEQFGMSQLTATTTDNVTVLGSGNPLPTPATVELPVPGVPSDDLAAARAAINAYYEPLEGMLVSFPDTLSVSEYFELARYGQVILREGGRPHTFTAVNEPSESGLVNHTIDLARRTVILDDTDNRQNRPVDAPNTPYYHPVPGLSTSNFFRGGDTISNLTGVLHWSFAGQTGTDAWRIRPVTEAYSYAFTPVNTRPAEVPDVGGRLTVASFNVLNYFLTIDTTASNEVGTCGPSGTLDCRGADSAVELERQRAKLLAALSAMDADVVGLMEMENTPGVEPLADIVGGLPGYAYVDTGVIGTDAIRVGIIYKTSAVTPVGPYAILDGTVDPRFDTSRNRPALAQTFQENATGARFTVVVNHLKSKGSGCGPGDDDTTTGQGNCNLTRTRAAQALADWLATDPTGSGDTDALIIGDLNSYAKEDPIVALQDAGFTDLVAAFGGPSAYGYVFDGQLGYLDHALANAALASQVTGVADWHLNADEVPLFDYNDEVRDAGEAAFEEESDVLPLFEPTMFRTSDHDPVLVGLSLDHWPYSGAGQAGIQPAKAGTKVPLVFSLGGDRGMAIFAPGYPASVEYECGTPPPLDATTPIVGTDSMKYDAKTDSYTIKWKTDKSWAGTCRRVVLKLADGTYHYADFAFRPS